MNKKVTGMSAVALQKLLSYSWPGNVRELENTIEYAIAMTTGDIISEDLILQTQATDHEQLKPLKEAKNEFEKNYITGILSLTKGNVSKAAKLAGKYRPDFYTLLKKHSLEAATFKNLKTKQIQP